MQTSLFLAKLLGPVLFVTGIGLLANRVGYQAMAKEFLKSRALIYLAGLLALIPGLALVLFHNVWAADWRVLITLFGWLLVIGGVFRIVFPGQVMKTGKAMMANPNTMIISGGCTLVLGAALSFFGYSA